QDALSCILEPRRISRCKRKDIMKTLPLALMIPVAVCTVCVKNGTSIAAQPAASASTPAVGAAPAPPRTTAKVSLVAAPGSSVKGDLTLTNEGIAVAIRGEITGLAPGREHGFHVHEV